MLEEEGALAAGAVDALEADVQAEIEDAVAFAEAGALEPVSELERFVYSEAAR